MSRQKKFSREQEVTLAQEVEKRPLLWDCTLDIYRRADLKGEKWADVAGIVGGGCTGDDVSRRWKNMKETFQTNYRKVREQAQKCSGAGTDDLFRPNWFLYKHLTFLIKTCAQAESTSNITQDATETTIESDSHTETAPSSLEMYYDENLQDFILIPDDTQNASDDNSSSAFTSVCAKSVPSPVQSLISLKTPARPSSAPPIGSKRSAPQEGDHFYNQKGMSKKSSTTLLHSAVKAIEKIVSEPPPKMPDLCALTPSNEEPADQFSKFIASRLKVLDSESRKLCENEILQVIMKY